MNPHVKLPQLTKSTYVYPKGWTHARLRNSDQVTNTEVGMGWRLTLCENRKVGENPTFPCLAGQKYHENSCFPGVLVSTAIHNQMCMEIKTREEKNPQAQKPHSFLSFELRLRSACPFLTIKHVRVRAHTHTHTHTHTPATSQVTLQETQKVGNILALKQKQTNIILIL